jgi:hypothetical protein
VKLEPAWAGEPPSTQSTTNLWTLEGVYVNQFTQACATCSVDYFNNSLQRTNEFLTNWWVSGEPYIPGAIYEAKLDYGMTFPNGQHCVLSEKAFLSMLRPLPTFTTPVRDTVRVGTNFGINGQIDPGWRLQFGRNTPNTNIDVGIAYVYTSAPLDLETGTPFGRYFITQLITAFHQQYNERDGTNCVGTELHGSGLDGANPYQGYATETSGEWSDAPGGGLTTASWLSMSTSFKSFLMFQPKPYDTSGNIGVPMYEVAWAWSGTARPDHLGGWMLVSGSPPVNPTPFETKDFPRWTNDVINSMVTTNSLPCFNEN